ncbi:MAG: PEP-CTERM sorting domain-containing protein [Phycisphaerae bacterium]
MSLTCARPRHPLNTLRPLHPSHPLHPLLTATALLTLFASPILIRAAGPADFRGIGALPGSRNGSIAYAISDDGSAVTGISDQSDLGGPSTVAFLWQADTMISLGDLPGGSTVSEAGGVSANGSAAAGMSASSNGTEAFRWEAGVMVGLGDVPGGDVYSHAFRISGDGTTVVGLSRSANGDAAFRWQAGAMRNLADDFPGGLAAGWATDASFDGSVVVGYLATTSGPPRPMRWENNVATLIDIAPADVWGQATAVSPDGQSIAGTITHQLSPLVREAFFWRDGTLTLLGDLPGGATRSSAADVSGDGSIVVGTGRTSLGDEAFIWTAARGLRRVRDLLEQDYGLNLAGWQLTAANGISADGLTIAGSGVNPLGQPEAWLAHIGCALAGDMNNDARCDGGDVEGFVRCLTTGLGCGCGDFDADQTVGPADVAPFVDRLLGRA